MVQGLGRWKRNSPRESGRMLCVHMKSSSMSVFGDEGNSTTVCQGSVEPEGKMEKHE
jgi:hypothetical protein